MIKRALCFLSCVAGFAAALRAQPVVEPLPGSHSTPRVEPATEAKPAETTAAGKGKTSIFVIPVRDQIADPTLFVIRNGVKDAIAAKAEYVVLNMDTPGGSLGATLEIMKILEKFKGRTVTFVNEEAISAGALISAATDEIYFTPSGVIGAAAPVMGGGEDIDKTMKQKVVSYLRARVRSISAEHPYRGDVVSAMIDSEFELKVGETVIKPKGELLTLTAPEAIKQYGDPPTALLGAGIVDDLPALYRTLSRGGEYDVREFEMTWSIRAAEWLTKLSPLLMSAGMLLLFIEFKTPGFGVIGISGIVLILIVLFGHNVAGLSGHEPMLFFVLGVVLVFIELMLFPGTIVLAAIGLLMMLGSLLWGMADIWPSEGFDVSPQLFVKPAFNVALAFVLAVGLAIGLARFLPKSTLFSRMVLAAEIRGASNQPMPEIGASTTGAAAPAPAVGDLGVVVNDLHPVGVVEILGRRFEARVEVGEVRAGARVRVVRRSDFGLVVEEARA